MERNETTKRLVIIAMMSAMAFVLVATIRIPVVLFLKYEPKDVIITIGGFMMGPMAAAAMSLVVSFVEMFIISDTGIIGCIMNILSTCTFACPAAILYKRNKTIRRAIEGLALGVVLMTGVMLLWNYLITPLYMTGTTREAIAGMLIPVFLPFNLLKAGLNMALTLLLYKPIITALRRASLLPPSQSGGDGQKRKMSGPVLLFGALLLATCVLLLLVYTGKI